MIIVMKLGADESQVQETIQKIKDLGFNTHLSKGENRTIIGVIGDVSSIDESDVERLRATPYIEEVVRVSKPYKLVSRDFNKEDTIINVDGIEIGGKKIVVMAGPCTVESKDQIINIAREVKNSGATILRGGAFNPHFTKRLSGTWKRRTRVFSRCKRRNRTSHCYRGHGHKRCKTCIRICRHTTSRN